MWRLCRNGGEKPAQAGWCDNSQSGLQEGRSASGVRRKAIHAREDRGCVQPSQFGLSSRAGETRSQLVGSLDDAANEASSRQALSWSELVPKLQLRRLVACIGLAATDSACQQG